MIGVAAGLSSEGIIPTVHTIAPFMVERALEQIKVDLAYQALPGNLVSVGASLDYAALGCTHHCPADINLMNNIPGVDIYIPGHADEFAEMFSRNWNNGRLNYFRLSEQQNMTSFKGELGRAVRVSNGELGTVIAVGPILEQVMSAIKGMPLELHYASSFSAERDIEINLSNTSKKVIFIEPYYSGLLMQKSTSTFSSQGYEVLQIGIPRDFVRKYGTHSEQLKFVGLDSASIRQKIASFLEK